MHFAALVHAAREPDAREVVQPGELAFWIAGRCIAIGYGRTPVSRAEEIRLAARTNIWGGALGDGCQLRQRPAGAPIAVEPLSHGN